MFCNLQKHGTAGQTNAIFCAQCCTVFVSFKVNVVQIELKLCAGCQDAMTECPNCMTHV